ncbi:GDP-mannose 4,6-dehydratase [Candidatus Woesearchaeota archaeon]|nr:GDP-mannose 4,6-dehydratase [Candidatus Woesearchaeota archaeon]
MDTVLVTGGAGFIGSHVCEELLKSCKVICLDSIGSDDGRRGIVNALSQPNFAFVSADITGNIEQVFQQRRIDCVVHLAAKTGVRHSILDPKSYFAVNVNGTLNILNLCRKYKVKKMVFASSSSVYGSANAPFTESQQCLPDSPYGVSKLAAEHLCRIYSSLYGMNIVCLRFFTVYGPRGRADMAPFIFTDRISRDQPITVFGDGSSMRDYTYVKDAVSAVMAAMSSDLVFEVINVGNSRPVKLIDFIAVVEKLLGKKADIAVAPNQPGDMKATCADIAKARKLLNYNPAASVEQGMAEFVEWYKHKGFG